jgi:hypothetical protein
VRGFVLQNVVQWKNPWWIHKKNVMPKISPRKLKVRKFKCNIHRVILNCVFIKTFQRSCWEKLSIIKTFRDCSKITSTIFL